MSTILDIKYFIDQIFANFTDLNAARTHRYQVNIGSGHGMVSPGYKPLPSQTFTKNKMQYNVIRPFHNFNAI